MEYPNVGRMTGLGCAVHHGDGGCPGYLGTTTGGSGALSATPAPMLSKPLSEIDQELDWNSELIAILGDVIASLADKLSPVIPSSVPAVPENVAGSPPRQSPLARRLAENNFKLEDRITKLRALRDEVQF